MVLRRLSHNQSLQNKLTEVRLFPNWDFPWESLQLTYP